MVTTQSELIDQLAQAALEVFETMVFRTLTAGPVVEGDGPVLCDGAGVAGTIKVVGTIGFTGSQNGVVAFHSSLGVAREITGAMLGLSAEEVDDEVPDAIGEITNMIAGSFRTRMAREGDAWAISVPTVIVGSDFRMKPVACRMRALLPLRMGQAHVCVELILGG